jgi:hypothetical protein
MYWWLQNGFNSLRSHCRQLVSALKFPLPIGILKPLSLPGSPARRSFQFMSKSQRTFNWGSEWSRSLGHNLCTYSDLVACAEEWLKKVTTRVPKVQRATFQAVHTLKILPHFATFCHILPHFRQCTRWKFCGMLTPKTQVGPARPLRAIF